MTIEVSVILALVLGGLFYASKSVSPSGAIAGGLLTFVYGLAWSPFPFVAFAAFVVIGTLSSRIGRHQKRSLGVYQNEKGPRDWSHAIANCGVGALIVCGGRLFPEQFSPSLAALLASASLSAVCADTCASEWGTWLGGEPRNILNFRPAKIGSDGAVTWRGTLAGLLGAALIAGSVAPFVSEPGRVAVCLIAAGAIGNIADSIFGATVEPHLGRHGGSYVNAACSIVGAASMAILIA
ncbi:MAG: hypothetical protein ACI97A_002514 [Planctomycetota bacterium]|jgi:uncharacterized protein (TIGR00297 family)